LEAGGGAFDPQVGPSLEEGDASSTGYLKDEKIPGDPQAPPVQDALPRAETPNFLTSTRFSDFDLPPKIIEGLDAAGFLCTTPIQAQVIPEALKGIDIAAQAQTGTGKTVAFLVPLMARILSKPSAKPGLPRALIVTPTRELAEQIYQDGKILSDYTDLNLTLVIGGMGYKEQARDLGAGTDIVVGTPGRLIDHLHRKVFQTEAVEVCVVDEADRLLDMGFVKDLQFILSRLPSYESRQTMLFSATLNHQVLELTYQYMNPPQYITAEPGPLSQGQIEEELYHVARGEKVSLLMGILKK
jgi:ATP-dependent RNA helicase RhlB